MLDTIIYIPTILAYAFITLLVVILSFIVVYVSHKIYISVYDNLPVPTLNASSILTDTSSTEKNEAVVYERSSANSILTKQAQIVRKSKAALKIIVTLQPCYLAYVVFETRKPANIIVPASKATESATPSAAAAAVATSSTAAAPVAATVSQTSTAKTSVMNSLATIDDNCDCIQCDGDNSDNANNAINIVKTNHINFSSPQNELKTTSTSLVGKSRYIRYYDRLTDIPHGKVMQHCRYGPIRAGKDIRHPDLVLLSNVYDSIANRRT